MSYYFLIAACLAQAVALAIVSCAYMNVLRLWNDSENENAFLVHCNRRLRERVKELTRPR